MIASPPDYVIEAARLAAIRSPCEKSKRGAAIFNHETHSRLTRLGKQEHLDLALLSTGFNGQPSPFTCDGSPACRVVCDQVCVHAEQRAIMGAPYLNSSLDLLHVKVIDGAVVPGGGPSCWQCSRLVVEARLRGVWLYEYPPGDLTGHDLREVVGVWRFYDALNFHRITCGLPIKED